MSFTVAAQQLLVVLYFLRFRKSELWLCVFGIVCVVISQAGWILLCCIFVLPWHMVGFGMFVSALLIYWVVIIILDKIEFQSDYRLYIVFALSFMFCFLYSMFYVLYNDISWFYEHLAFIFFCVANIAFFLTHDSNPTLVVELDSRMINVYRYLEPL
jgi:hypothetical protein